MGTQHSLYWTTRASNNFHRYLPAGQDQVIKVVRTAVRKHAAGLDWHDGKKAVQGLRTHAVYELRSTRAHRVLVHPDGSDLVIVDVGEHEVVPRYAQGTAALHQLWLETKLLAPEFFQPTYVHPLLVDADEGVESELPEELDSGWLSYLDEEQAAVTNRVFTTALLSRLKQDDATYAFLVHGGAGTGKTAILANLATRFAELSIPVRLECSPAVRRYLRQYARLRSDLLDGPLTRGGVLLVDDPRSTADVHTSVQRALGTRATAVVVAFDPMQWREKRAAQTMTELGLDRYPNQYHLRTCYRQGNVIATEANRIMTMVHEQSSWRVASERIEQDRAFLRSIQARYLSDLEFVKKGGRVKTYSSNLLPNMRAEAARLAERWDRWKDMPALLMLEDRERGATFPETTALQGVSRLTMSLQDVTAYRGLDFQAVWILLSKELHVRLTRGELGLGTPDWEELRDLHVAVTRAKDELVVFAR